MFLNVFYLNQVKMKNEESTNNNLNIIEKKNNSDENISKENNEKNNSPQNILNENKINSDILIIEKIKEKSKFSEPTVNIKKDYNKIIKDYINLTAQEEKYEEQIKSNPLSLFESIDEQKIKSWESTLYNISPKTKKIPSEKEGRILSNSIKLDEQRIIINDCKRTRVRESILYNNYKETLEKVLTYYCQKFKVTYKQGLNEIFGPLLLMQYKLKNYSLVSIINLGARLIDIFLPNYFYEKQIYSLKSALGLFILLLKYHEPTVYNKLDQSEIRPEIYATNWLVNYMSAKVELNIFYEIWDQMLNIKDPLFIQFMLVAVIKYHREMLINCNEHLLASIITCLTIKTKEELDIITKYALELREKTPYSFRILANKIGFLRKNYKDIQENYERFQPETLPAMPIFPSEVLFITYKSEIDCIDSRCRNYIKCLEKLSPDHRLTNRVVRNRGESRTVKEKNKSFNFRDLAMADRNHLCEKCDMKIEKQMKYILLDLRILQYNDEEDDTDKTGFLPMMINVSQEELKSEDFSNIMTKRFITERGNYHFIFLTSDTDRFSNFERNYYKDNISEEDKKKMLFGVIKQQKIDKELNIDNAMKQLDLKQTYKLKEYDNMRNTLKSMTKHNFPYIGYVYGGFKEIHKESKRFKVELLSHNKETCLLCNEKSKLNQSLKLEKTEEEKEEEKSELYKSLWEHKKKIKYKNLDIFFKNPNNQMHLCVLKEYKNKNIENEQVQILINELFDQFEIEIYKFDKQKQYIDFENTIQIMDKKEKKKYYDLGKDEKDEDTNIDLELTLLEKISVVDIVSINANQKSNNIVNVSIREGDKKDLSDFIFGLFKKKDNIPTHKIVFDFSSSKDSRNFITSFKSLISLYKEKLKNK